MSTEKTDESNVETATRLRVAELQADRAKMVMESLAGLCHALGQPATVLLSSMELLKMGGIDEETKRQVVDMCYDAVMEIETRRAEMKQRREYVAEAYLAGNESAGNMISLGEWHDEKPADAGQEK